MPGDLLPRLSTGSVTDEVKSPCRHCPEWCAPCNPYRRCLALLSAILRAKGYEDAE